MLRGGSPPEEYVAFVVAYADALRRAATRAVGHDQQTESALHETLSALALRWGRLAEDRRLPYVLKRLDQNLREWREGAHPVPLSLEDTNGTAGEALYVGTRSGKRWVAEPATLAEAAWSGAGVIRRRRFLIAGGGVALAGLFALGSQVTAEPDPDSTEEPPPATLPREVLLLPDPGALVKLPQRRMALPVQIAPLDTAPSLSASPVPKALALLETSEAVFVLGSDGLYRKLPDIVVTLRPWVTPTALTRDGTRAVFAGNNVIHVVDFPSGQTRTFPIRGFHVTGSWLADGRALIGQGARSFVVDPVTGQTRPVPYEQEDIAIGPGLLQLTVAREGMPAKLQRWPDSATDSAPAGPPTGAVPDGTPATRIELQASPAMRWVGFWDGAAWLSGDLVARVCSASSLRMPRGYGRPQWAVAVVNTAGQVKHALVQQSVNGAVVSTPVILGWLDAQTLLVRAGDSTYRPIVAWTPSTGALELVSGVHAETKVAVSNLA
ncbi:hypothetical protein [Longispora albida]|uniref:hypothetical protein n=1 Tax=Longispora albida TaxID=203523 RepID=UPI0003780A18|nr:hypothetical protein [Longispora albida]